jgi:PAS domain S-box-containing protein
MADQAAGVGGARLTDLLELTRDAIIVREVGTSAVTYWSSGAERLYGWPRAEAVGQITHTLLDTRFPESIEAVDAALLRDGRWEGELNHRCRDGSRRIVSSLQILQRGGQGERLAVLEVNTDVTAQRQAELALDRLSRLHRVRSGLAETLTPPEVVSLVLSEAVPALGAASGSVTVDGQALATVGVAATGSSESAPLVVDGRTIGEMKLTFDAPRSFDLDERALFGAFANQCAQALERTRLYQLAQQVAEDLRRSRDQLAAILGGIAEGVTVQGPDGRLVYSNDTAARMSGFASAAALLAAPISEIMARFVLFNEAGEPLPLEQLPGRLLLRGEPAEEIIVQYRDVRTGERRWTIMNATAVRDDDGRLQLVVNIFRDITERKRQGDATAFLAAASHVLSSSLDAESAMAELAKLAVRGLAEVCMVDLVNERGDVRRLAVASAGDADAEASIPGELTAIIQRVARGGHAELVDGRAIVAPIRTRGATLGVMTLMTVSEGRRYRPADIELVEDLGARAALALENSRLFREAQEQAEHQATLNSALRDTIDERDRALADLQQALRTRDEFLASASHDLKNPLASMKATAQLLQRRLERSGEQELARINEGLHRIDSIATRAAQLVEELLDLARMQMGRPLDLDRRPVDLVHLTRDVVVEQQQTTDRHTLRLDADVAELRGMFDAERLRRVFTNLVDNAIKYSPSGGDVVLRVSESEPGSAVIDVQDHGIGVPPEDVERIFERFHRASNVEGRIAGTGIGLASARHIVESHGGTIQARSGDGGGTLFRIHLPLEPRGEVIGD